MRKPINAIREATGMTIDEFCERILLTNYKSFSYRLRVGRLYQSEIKRIIEHTNMTFEELFMDIETSITFEDLARGSALKTTTVEEMDKINTIKQHREAKIKSTKTSELDKMTDAEWIEYAKSFDKDGSNSKPLEDEAGQAEQTPEVVNDDHHQTDAPEDDFDFFEDTFDDEK